MAQTKRDRGRKQQGQGPQGQQGQCTTGLGFKPTIPETTPALEQPRPSQTTGHQGTRPGAPHVKHPIEVGRHPHRQEHLQRLHHQRQDSSHQSRHGGGRPLSAAAVHGQRQQKTQGGIAQHVGKNVKSSPVAWPGCGQECPRYQALKAPVVEGVQAGVADQDRIQPEQRPSGCFAPGGLAHKPQWSALKKA